MDPQSRSGQYGEVNILNHTGTRTPTPRPASLSKKSYIRCATSQKVVGLIPDEVIGFLN
jgi:hypothetical protein